MAPTPPRPGASRAIFRPRRTRAAGSPPSTTRTTPWRSPSRPTSGGPARVDLAGATVTSDAIGCQRDIAGQIVGGGGDYALPVKDNQPGLLKKVKALLDEAVLAGFAGMSHGFYEEAGAGHGRAEARRV